MHWSLRRPDEYRFYRADIVGRKLLSININNHYICNKGEIKWIAISRDLLNYFKYGDKVILSNEDGSICGIYEIHDTMNHRHKNRIDILFPETKKLGKWCNGEMRKVG